jgi:hypothetical protein
MKRCFFVLAFLWQGIVLPCGPVGAHPDDQWDCGMAPPQALFVSECTVFGFPLHHAVRNRLLESVQKALKGGCGPNSRNKAGQVPLLVLVSTTYAYNDDGVAIEIARELIRHGARLDTVRDDGKTLLQIASFQGAVRFGNFLREAGAY